jgi:hypothetical protein
MNDIHNYHDTGNRLPSWLVAVLLVIILLVLGVQTVFAGFCWAG